MGFSNMSQSCKIMNPSYELVLIILKQDLQLEYEINICTQPTFMKHGHRYNQFLKIYKSELIHHRLIYIALSRLREKENLYLLAPLVEANFKVDKFVSNEMQRLKQQLNGNCVYHIWNILDKHTQ